MVKNQPANAGDAGDKGLIPGLGRSLGVGTINPLQYSCLENSMDRRARQTTPMGCKELDVTKHTHINQRISYLTILATWQLVVSSKARENRNSLINRTNQIIA